ncbi:aminotransferase class I/II-fold pyridoxal phosphate-dependent enzyme [Haloechinothrix sp. YIM 98757]|uniref:Aminotransferase n=1 Tax=Haloechinothrix aidingensis TaxID=2752311 RepID=A0A838A347_9PSEU|nr:aminotransferase class I/II-fold pyridoxal phosphate-dependent enzyme [Haloechinothrix aidingensis]
MVVHSATLELDERVRARRAAGHHVVHLGFGEAGLPVLPEVREVLAGATGLNSYGPVVGSAEARGSAAGYFARRGLPTEPEQVIYGPGSKALLFALLSVLGGDIVLPRPSWVSYAAQAGLTGRGVIGAPISEVAGGVPEPNGLERVLEGARADGRKPAAMILTLPDNPTGTLAPAEQLEAICDIAQRYELLLICDEIYRDLVYHPERFRSPATIAPERTVVTSGLSKAMALGGWRIGLARLPDGRWGTSLRTELVGVAGEIWSSLAAPMQEVAGYVYSEPEEVVAYVSRGRRLHEAVSTAVHRVLVSAGARCRPPQAAFYLYPDLAPLRGRLAGTRVTGGTGLAELLLERHGVGVLAGTMFGDDPGALRLRVATSLLYGDTEEQRWRSLHSENPTTLPWIADALDRLRRALAELGKR